VVINGPSHHARCLGDVAHAGLCVTLVAKHLGSGEQQILVAVV
jgi:hypothetical protein